MVCVIGITGGIASGKSSLSKLLFTKLQEEVSEGCDVNFIDADKLGHLAYVPGSPAYHELVKSFGAENILTDCERDHEDRKVTGQPEIDRRKLGGIVFSNKDKMDSLCEIVWPVIRSSIERTLKELASCERKQYVILEAAVMLEAKWEDMVSGMLIVTYVEKDLAKSRLMERNSLSEEEALKRINTQMSNSERLGRVCSNDNDCTSEVTFEEHNVTFYGGTGGERIITTFDNRGTEDDMKDAASTIIRRILVGKTQEELETA